jgi:Tfp pilus assembly protein PilF
MPPFWFVLTSFLVLLVFFLAWRLARSRTWKQIQLRKAARLAAMGRTEEMLTYLKRNMNRRDVSDPITNALVYFYIKSGQFDPAESIILKAIEKGDSSAMAIAQLGYVAGGRKDTAGAEEYYRKALAMDESLRPTMNINIAGLLIESGDRLEEAEELLMEALELREGTARSGIHTNLALLYLKTGRPVEARVQAMTAYELLPSGSAILNASRANALALASRACAMQGEDRESSKLAAKALKLIEDLPGMERMAEELGHLASTANGDKPPPEGTAGDS